MKVLLACKSKMMENLGVMYLSAVIKQTGHLSRIVTFDEVIRVAKSWQPDIVGYSVMTGDQHRVKLINDSLKLSMRKKPPMVIVGGPHPSFFSDDFKNDPNVNIVMTGEAEQTIASLLGSEILYPDINSFPWPDRADFPNMKIRDFISSRGCPYNCSYCYNDQWSKLFKGQAKVRVRTVKDVINEIDVVSPDFVYFQDSCFAVSDKWLREFSPAYAKRIHIPFHCHLRPNQVNEERVLLLGDAGCISVRIALESASKRLRKLMNRETIDLNKVSEAVRLFKKWGIKLMIQNIIGLPTATIEEDLETLEFNIKCKPAYAWVSIFSPYPGTKLGDQCQQEGWYTGNYSEIGDNFFDKSVLNFSPEYKEQLECLQKVFALCVEVGYMPQAHELNHKDFPKLVHKIMRWQGDKRLYGGVI